MRHGNSSLASSIGASIYETNHTTYEIYHIPTNFYVRLTGKFTDGGLFRMAYHNSIETAKGMILLNNIAIVSFMFVSVINELLYIYLLSE